MFFHKSFYFLKRIALLISSLDGLIGTNDVMVGACASDFVVKPIVARNDISSKSIFIGRPSFLAKYIAKKQFRQ
ncbi:hypothetical protein A5893_12420 [Pedobacter psychrophilus]|uniref:Uncharacterized protein n=1 Tax=Pedobacter psychrophilus TaxID=1826909 RepID=A0A179DEF3_9SPHI|nr:hypothetical protein [Pedobacter psychrophilus]OAQ38843.1 hypothetical protein A5893_12420 [Pedobacter psychrophilus]